MKLGCALVPLIPALLLGGLLMLPEVPFDQDPTIISDEKNLPPKIRDWLKTGTFRTVNGWKLFTKIIFPAEVTSEQEQQAMMQEKTPAVLLHGFPSSSFEFHRVAQPLADKINAPVILLDHLGFGFSEKPKDSDLTTNPLMKEKTESSLYSYSCLDHAEHVFMLLEELKVTKAHFVSHDMGDTILAEMLGRRFRGTLPARFTGPEFFQSVTFTNGGMVYKHISKRLGQIILTTPGLSDPAQRIINRLDPSGKFIASQLKSVWSPTVLADPASQAQAAEDIEDIATLLRWQGGHRIMNYLIRYLPDRATFESRWHPALKNLHKIVAKRCGYVWGDSDAVAPMAIVHTLQAANPGNCPLQTIEGHGHFLQLETPEKWVEAVARNIVQ